MSTSPVPRLPVLLLLLLGCTFDHAAAGEVCVYTARSEGQVQRELPAFVAAHPDIRLRCPGQRDEYVICNKEAGRPCDRRTADWEVVRQSTGTLTDTVSDETRAHGRPAADVLWGVAISHVRHLSNEHPGLFRRYLPESADILLRSILWDGAVVEGSLWSWFLDPAYLKQTQAQPLWVGVDAFAVAFCVNTRKLAELEPAVLEGTMQPSETGPIDPEALTWDDLLDPRLTGRIAAPQPNVSGTGFAQLLGELSPGFDACAVGEACDSWQYLDRFDPQVALYTRSGDLPCELAAVHDSPIVVGVTHDAADFLKPDRGEEGAPAGFYDRPGDLLRIIPAGAGFDVAVSVLVDRPELVPAAHTFLDWASGPDAMALYAESTPLVAYDPNTTDLPPELAAVRELTLDFLLAAQRMDDLKSAWSCRYCADAARGAPLDDRLRETLRRLEAYELEEIDADAVGRCAKYCE